ncbi:MAG TPA: hypothetical protein VFK02_19980 [Kofleriaceae bacterium]|nr:hypothetical protein [Kofleriaceae bacterium]
MPLTHLLQGTQWWSLDALRELQAGLLHRLIRHASAHTAHYRTVLEERGLTPDDIRTVEDLRLLPLLDRDHARDTFEARSATGGPPGVVKQASSDATGAPVVVTYNAESRHWREATRWRGHGWAGYRIGMRALRYAGTPPGSDGFSARANVAADHLDRHRARHFARRLASRLLGRDLFIDCVVRSEAALAHAVREIKRFEPDVIMAHAGGAAALARFVLDHGLRTWGDLPVITSAERLWPFERGQIHAAFGPAFETYGCREMTLIGAECEAHDGMHTSMENLIVELVVREPDGRVRAARAGEPGLVAITDLHNLACPMIRYVTGDVAVSRGEDRCACRRSLIRIGPVDAPARHLQPTPPRVARLDEIPLTDLGTRNVVVVEPERARLGVLTSPTS